MYSDLCPRSWFKDLSEVHDRVRQSTISYCNLYTFLIASPKPLSENTPSFPSACLRGACVKSELGKEQEHGETHQTICGSGRAAAQRPCRLGRRILRLRPARLSLWQAQLHRPVPVTRAIPPLNDRPSWSMNAGNRAARSEGPTWAGCTWR